MAYDHITLLGAEDVRRASISMENASDVMRRAMDTFEQSSSQLQRAMETHADRLEAPLAAQLTPKADPIPKLRVRPGFWGGLIVQVEDHTMHAGDHNFWRDAKVSDLLTFPSP